MSKVYICSYCEKDLNSANRVGNLCKECDSFFEQVIKEGNDYIQEAKKKIAQWKKEREYEESVEWGIEMTVGNRKMEV